MLSKLLSANSSGYLQVNSAINSGSREIFPLRVTYSLLIELSTALVKGDALSVE